MRKSISSRMKISNHRRFFLCLFFLSFCLGAMIPVQADAASIYLPLKTKTYSYRNRYNYSVPKEGWNQIGTVTCKRNKYGMVTSHVSKVKNSTNKITYKYTFKDGLLTKVKVNYKNDKNSNSTIQYKYNKQNKVVSKLQYNNKGKLTEKTLYTYKVGKLVKERHYNGGTLANTYKYRWKNNKVAGYTEYFKGGEKGHSVAYYYKGSKISSTEQTTPNDPNKSISRYNKKGHCIEDESIDYSDKEAIHGYNYYDCQYNLKGRLTSVTDYVMEGTEKILWYKTVYSSYKKYKRPKGDPMVNNDYIYDIYNNMVPTVPVK